MKWSYAIFFSSLLSCFVFHVNGQYKNDLDEYNLSGRVKSITVQEWIISDSLGKTTRKKSSAGTGLFGWHTVFNPDGWIVSKTDPDSSNGKKSVRFQYDKYNELLGVVTINKDRSESETFYEYESLGTKKITYAVNEKGERWKVKETEKGPTGKPVSETVYERPDTVACTTQFSYNGEGRLNGMTTVYTDGRKEVWSWKWNRNVKQQGISMVYMNGKKTGSTTYFYDQYNQVTRSLEVRYGTNTNTGTLYEYTYDKQGNWITRKRYTMVDGKKSSFYHLAERTIAYYH